MRNSDYISALRNIFDVLFGSDGFAIPLVLISLAFIIGWSLAVKIFAYFVKPTRFEFFHHFKSTRKDK